MHICPEVCAKVRRHGTLFHFFIFFSLSLVPTADCRVYSFHFFIICVRKNSLVSIYFCFYFLQFFFFAYVIRLFVKRTFTKNHRPMIVCCVYKSEREKNASGCCCRCIASTAHVRFACHVRRSECQESTVDRALFLLNTNIFRLMSNVTCNSYQFHVWLVLTLV